MLVQDIQYPCQGEIDSSGDRLILQSCGPVVNVVWCGYMGGGSIYDVDIGMGAP